MTLHFTKEDKIRNSKRTLDSVKTARRGMTKVNLTGTRELLDIETDRGTLLGVHSAEIRAPTMNTY